MLLAQLNYDIFAEYQNAFTPLPGGAPLQQSVSVVPSC